MKSAQSLIVISILISIVLSAIMLTVLSESTVDNFEDFAMGEGTSVHFASSNGLPIHIRYLTKESADSMTRLEYAR